MFKQAGWFLELPDPENYEGTSAFRPNPETGEQEFWVKGNDGFGGKPTWILIREEPNRKAPRIPVKQSV